MAVDGNRAETYYSSKDGTFSAGFYVDRYAELTLGVAGTSFTTEAKELYGVTDLEFLNGNVPGFLRSTAEKLGITQCNSPAESVAQVKQSGTQYSIKSTKPVTAIRSGYVVGASKFFLNIGTASD
jgi:hypothetical protein